MKTITKSTILILIFCFFQQKVISQGWQKLHPVITDAWLGSVWFPDSLTGYVVGAKGTILKTSSAGRFWRQQESPTTQILYSVCFLDSLTGYAVGDTGTIIKTIDGGANWTLQNSGTTNTLFTVHFISENTGFTSGANGTILKTINGGNAWIPCGMTSSEEMKNIFFTDQNTGYVIGTEYPGGSAVYKTVNSGQTWNQLTLHPSKVYYLYSLFFPTTDTGYVGGLNGAILKTCNGGSTWVEQQNSNGEIVKAIYFLNKDTGWVVGGGYGSFFYILKTTDGGITWNSIANFNFDGQSLNSLFFTSDQTGFAVSGSCLVAKTTDGGINWKIVTLHGHDDFRSILFIDSLTGFTSSGGHTIQKTINGGLDWEITYMDAPSQFLITKMCFPSKDTGFAIGDDVSGKIYFTTNAGESWDSKELTIGPVEVPRSITFPDHDTGYVLGSNGYPWNIYSFIYKTVDGGTTWERLTFTPAYSLSAIHFITANNGFIAGSEGRILKTTNGGNSWTSLSSGTSNWLFAMAFPVSDTGYIVGDNGIILTTTDGGQTWTEQTNPSPWTLWDVCFTDSDNGYAVGDSGTILHTVNGGSNWELQVTGTRALLYSVSFPDEKTGYATGFTLSNQSLEGIILKTTNGGNVWIGDHHGGKKPDVSVFPNPSRVDITITVKTTCASWVSADLFTITGTRVRNKDWNVLSPSIQRFDMERSDLPPGIYFLVIQTENEVISKKIVFL